MSAISTHVLDVAAGRPAAGMRVRLERVAPPGAEGAVSPGMEGAASPGAEEIAAATTDAGGRIASLGPEEIGPGTYRLVFDTGGYLARQRAASESGSGNADAGNAAFFPEVAVTFSVAGPGQHYHIPLLVSPFGYSTYRGS